MAKGIKARRKGDAYQSRVFWVHALQMATGTSGDIESVAFELDDVSFMDDVIVRYRQPIRDLVGGRDVRVDSFQCKYHMTVGAAFSVRNLCDPKFLGKHAGRSMIQRMYDGFRVLAARGEPFRINLVTSYHWDHTDAPADHLHEGTFRPEFFEGSDRTKEGKARKALRDHLGIDERALRAFLETTRFHLGVTLTRLADQMRPLLQLAGLKPIDSEKSQVEYDDLIWNLFEQDRNVYEESSFREMTRREKLVHLRPSPHGEVTIKSMVRRFPRQPGPRHAELDLTELFEGRHPKAATCWARDAPTRIKRFFLGGDVAKLPAPVHVYFDCHLSIAFAAGHLLDPKLGLHAIPTQRNPKTGTYDLWAEPQTQEADAWEHVQHGTVGDELVLALSVTHPIDQHLASSLDALGLGKIARLELRPRGGSGHAAVASGELAWHLAYDLATFLRRELPATARKLHVFLAGPVALAYILGNTLRSVTPELQLYEHDFEGTDGAQRYRCALSLPINC